VQERDVVRIGAEALVVREVNVATVVMTVVTICQK
jgi:hypothetical protein